MDLQHKGCKCAKRKKTLKEQEGQNDVKLLPLSKYPNLLQKGVQQRPQYLLGDFFSSSFIGKTGTLFL